jgi:hypothetical protein
MKFIKSWLHNLIESWQKKRRDNKYKRGIYWVVVDNIEGHETDLVTIKLLKGPFNDITYSITDIHVIDDYGKISFDFDIRTPGFLSGEETKKFERIIGDILLIFLDDCMNNKKQLREEVLKDVNEEVGTDHIEEPADQRTVLPQSDAVPEAGILPRKTRKNPVRIGTKSRAAVQPKTKRGRSARRTKR